MTPTFIVFSHLRWDFVYQRPQHILSRIGRENPVLFVEEPVHDDGDPWLERIEITPTLTVLRPHTPVAAPGFHDDQLPVLRPLLAPVLSIVPDAVAWFYTPMALPLLADVDAAMVVYDCMDELSAFDRAPRQLRQRERALLREADLVFTGGQSLFEAKRPLHHAVHCFPSSVDRAHFAPPAPVDRASSTRTRLGFFGVVDERFDLDLLAALAAADPSWRIEIVGPVVKIDEARLPRAANIAYLGMKPYAELPSLVARWDVCLMPFALNESTRFISPTKVLEYMAADKPIVSTRITDVATPFSHVVRIADGPDAFVAACRAALAETDADAAIRRAGTEAILAKTSWDRTVDEMLALVDARDDSSTHLATTRPATDEPSASVVPFPSHRRDVESITTAVIGAGPTGLSALYHLDAGARLFERGPEIGGWCRSIVDEGFTFDCAGHIMFSNDPVVLALYDVLLGDNVHWQNREAWIYSHAVHTRYPFQGALHGLPPEVLKECLVGAIEARFGSLDGAVRPAAKPATTSPDACKSDDGLPVAENDDCCGDGEHARPDVLGTNVVALAELVSEAPKNFEDFIVRTWGAGVAKHFALPYNRKLWALPLTEMETSWLGGRVPLPDLAEMIEGAVQPAKKPVGPNARFGYPLRGGFQALMDGFKPHVSDRLRCDADVVQIDLQRHELELVTGERFAYDQLISTMPLPRLVDLLGDAAPPAVRQASAGLRHVSVRCVNLGVARAAISDKHWIYYPGDTVFHRIFLQGNTSPHCNPPGGFGLTCEITYGPSKPLPCEGDELVQRCFDDCVAVGLLRADDRLITSGEVDMDYAYVVYDHARATNVKTIRDWLGTHDVILAGRYSEWEYYNSDHAFLAGRRAAAEALHAGNDLVSA